MHLHYNSRPSINHASMKKDLCPCGSLLKFNTCCGQYLAGAWPESAEQLMRSRYTAFCKLDEDYLMASWHRSTRPASLGLSQKDRIKWIDLRVLSHATEGKQARIEFIARYKVNGKAHKLHENSRFVKEQGRWFYVDGDNIA